MKSKTISPSFPPEIIREILLKATVKSLLRCKAVCKDWYSLISDQHFIKSHYTLSSSSTNIINYDQHHRLICSTFEPDRKLISCPIYDVLFDKSVSNALELENPLQRPQRYRIVGSCNGLVCILGKDAKTLFISNPSTRATNILPYFIKQGSGSCFPYGFGYDETTHDYKVVNIWCRDPTSPYLATMIYSLKAGSWKEIGSFPGVNPFNVVNSFDDGKFLNGALHWATVARDMVSLDLRTETYGEVLQPEYAEGSKRLTLGVWGKWLCVFCNYYERRVVDVWVMKVYGMKDSWTKLVSISHSDARNLIPSYMAFHAPLCISNDGKLLLRFGTRLVVYDCKNGSYSQIQNFHVCSKARIVVESLVSPFAPLGSGDNLRNG